MRAAGSELENMVSKATRIAVIPDCHIPYQDEKALNTALQIIADYKPQKVIILGDFIDCAPVSHWNRENLLEREGMRLAKDYAKANVVLDQIGKTCKDLVYLNGNHEDWVYQMVQRQPELEGMIEPEVGLKFEERTAKGWKIKHLEYGKVYNLGKLWFTHGTYTSMNHAKKHVESYGRSIVYGHLHDVQLYTKVSPIDIEDKHIGLSLGCLSKKNPHFMRNRPNNWVHAIGLGVVRKDGTFNIDPVIISDGKASYGGVTYDGKKSQR
jgi:predicted phosphodiesterase